MIMESIEMWTRSPLDKLVSFYRDVMEFPILSSDERQITVKVGYSDMTFKKVTDEAGIEEHLDPFYHFAINIPENKLGEAKSWIESKLELCTEAGSDISRSELWDSHAVYFMDSGGNILEIIARHTMDNAIDRPFNPKSDLLGISEMGLPTRDVPRAVKELEELGIHTYKKGSPDFNPAGDEEGMFIVAIEGRRWHFTPLSAELFPFSVRIKGVGVVHLEEHRTGQVLAVARP
ncbi:VOC family protein [Paenibacillus sp. GCM10027627]|uniref:VOC family protein n=1 Tax=unclassified Paenibacillus TaxID=185978 RepID=UPI00362E1EEA